MLRPLGEDEAVVLLPDYDSQEVTGYLRVFLENGEENSEENREDNEKNSENNSEENSEENSFRTFLENNKELDTCTEKNESDVQKVEDYFVDNKSVHLINKGENHKEDIPIFSEGQEVNPTFDQELGGIEKEEPNLDKNLICKLCLASCSNSGNMNAHMAAKHGIARTFKCRWCRADFRSKDNMKNHQKR